MYLHLLTKLPSDDRRIRSQCSNGAGAKSNDIPRRSYKDTLPPPGGRVLQWIQIERPHTRQQIHLVCLDEESALVPGVDLPEKVKRDDDRCGEIFLEEIGRVGRTAGRL